MTLLFIRIYDLWLSAFMIFSKNGVIDRKKGLDKNPICCMQNGEKIFFQRRNFNFPPELAREEN